MRTEALQYCLRVELSQLERICIRVLGRNQVNLRRRLVIEGENGIKSARGFDIPLPHGEGNE